MPAIDVAQDKDIVGVHNEQPIENLIAQDEHPTPQEDQHANGPESKIGDLI